ncbi:MAG: HNH endonuclease [Acidimicrobiia bacterium]|nr:HNH endonuclease [Acidimicrobiia bacterium]
MAWSKTTGGSRGYGWEWRRTRERILERDGHRCTILDEDGNRCTEPAHAVDHRVGKAEGGTDDPSNLRSICRWHHVRVTARQSVEARKNRPSRFRPQERHPGLLP